MHYFSWTREEEQGNLYANLTETENYYIGRTQAANNNQQEGCRSLNPVITRI